MKHLVLDAHAILRFAQDEAGAEHVEELLVQAEKGQIKAFVCEINLGEVYYIAARRLGREVGRRLIDHLSTLAVQRVPADWELIASAADLKAQHSMSYADCFAAATALRHEASVVTGDPEYKKVEHLVPVDWI